MEMNFCRRCGTALTQDQGHIYKCANGHTLYVNASPAVGLFIVNEDDELLVTTRGIDPGKGTLDIPGGFVDGVETFEHAIAREMQEEIELNAKDYSTPQYLCSVMDPYSFGGETVDVLSAHFWARLMSNVTVTPQDDVSEIQFISLHELQPEQFFFSGVQDAARQLKELLS